MGKGYNNFMSKKPFHPASKENIKRVWMAEQRSIDAKKKEEEMRLQYEKEQDLYNNRLLVTGSDSKDKLSLNFMYEAPPGVRKENAKEIDAQAEPQYKFEWQRNAPRESFAKNNMEIRDQPFGIQVRNVRCLKCHKWGHVNTDRECPLYNASSSSMTSTDQSLIPDQKSMSSKSGDQQPPVKMEPNELIASMKDDQGLALKRSLYGNYGPESMKNNSHHEMISATAATSNPEQEFLESLSSKQKKLLLKKLQSLNRTTTKSTKSADRRKHSKKSKSKKKKSKKSKGHHKSSKDSSESSSSSDSDSESSDSKSSARRNHKHRRHHRSSSKTDHGDHHRKHRTDHHNDHRDDRHSKLRSRSPEKYRKHR